MGNFTKPFKFRPLTVKSSLPLNILAIFFLLLTSIWNLRSFVRQSVIRKDLNTPLVQSLDRLFTRRTFNTIDILARVTRLDQYWSIFAPGPPRDDSWFVAVSQLADGSTVDLFRDGQGVIWDKPTDSDRNRLYPTMQWRQYFINLDRSIGRSVYGDFGRYLCKTWNENHGSDKQIKSWQLYIMRERTVPPGEKQGIEKELLWKQNCS
jgi:hypothetical protein